MTNSLNNGETYRRLSEQAKRLPTPVSATTPWRWSRKGVRGIKLETVMIGGVEHCSDEALDRFLEALNAPKDSPVKTRRTKKQRRESAARAESILSAAGI